MSQANTIAGKRDESGLKFHKQGKLATFLTSEKVSGLVCAAPFIFGFLMFLLVPILSS